MNSNGRGVPQRRTSTLSALVAAVRHALVQHVRQAEDELVELRLDVGKFLVEARHPVAEFFARGQQRGDVLALGLGLADVLGVRIAGGTHFVRGNLRGLAALLERLEARDVELEAPTREVRGDGGRIGTEQAGVEHGGQLEGSGKREL